MGDKHGHGGTLTNVVPGGEQPLAVTLSVQIPNFGWHEAYHAARRFRVISKREKAQLPNQILNSDD
jgi:hypothetical protein